MRDARYFVWHSADWKTLTVDAATDGKVVAAETLQRGVITLRVVTDAPIVPESISWVFKKGEESWLFELPFDEARRLSRVVLPTGSWHVEVGGGKGFGRVYLNAVPVRHLRPTAVGELAIVRLPVVTGRVLFRDKASQVTSVPAAQIRVMPTEDVIAVARADGRFSGATEGVLPKSVRITAAGFAARTINVPSSGQVGDVVLDRGHTVRLTVRGCLPATVDLLPIPEAPRMPGDVRLTRDNTAEVEFESVPDGEYHILLSGPAPLQRFAEKISVTADFDHSLEVEPVQLEGRVTRGRVPAARAAMECFPIRPKTWQSTIVTDEEGHYSEEVWQNGLIGIRPRNRAGSAFLVQKAITSEEKQFLDIEVPAGQIAGRVTDKATGEPVRNARVTIAYRGMIRTFGGHTALTDGAGHFELNDAEAGKYVIQVEADGYRAAQAIGLELLRDQSVENVDFGLDHGNGFWIRVRDDEGRPVPNPYVVSQVWAGGRASGSPLLGDATGMVRLPLDLPAMPQTVFVFTAAGSYAKVQIEPRVATSEEKPFDVKLPVPRGGGLRVRIVSEDGVPQPGRELLIRLNGELIPPAVLESMQMLQGGEYRSGPDGYVTLPSIASGVYELWSFRSGPEYDRLIRALPDEGRATATISRSVVTVTVRERK